MEILCSSGVIVETDSLTSGPWRCFQWSEWCRTAGSRSPACHPPVVRPSTEKNDEFKHTVGPVELRHIRYFIAVAEELSFTRAAQRLFTSQPSLSEQVRNLEDEVGTPLLRRTKRSVELTDAGRVFLEEGRRVLEQAAHALSSARRVAERDARTIRIGFVPSAEVRVFPQVLPKLRQMFPGLHIVLRSLDTASQERALLQDEIDLAFMRPPLQHPELLQERVLTDPIRVFLPREDPLAKLARIPPGRLSDRPAVIADSAFSLPLSRLTDDYLTRHAVRRGEEHMVSNILLGVNLVGAGMGYALFPAYAETFCSQSVCVRPLKDGGPQFDLVMVTRPERGCCAEVLDAMMGLVRELSAELQEVRETSGARGPQGSGRGVAGVAIVMSAHAGRPA